MKMIKRGQYSAKLWRFKDKDLIKVVTGVRRCGKSTVLRMFRDELLASGIAGDRIAFLNFEAAVALLIAPR